MATHELPPGTAQFQVQSPYEVQRRVLETGDGAPRLISETDILKHGVQVVLERGRCTVLLDRAEAIVVPTDLAALGSVGHAEVAFKIGTHVGKWRRQERHLLVSTTAADARSWTFAKVPGGRDRMLRLDSNLSQPRWVRLTTKLPKSSGVAVSYLLDVTWSEGVQLHDLMLAVAIDTIGFADHLTSRSVFDGVLAAADLAVEAALDLPNTKNRPRP